MKKSIFIRLIEIVQDFNIDNYVLNDKFVNLFEKYDEDSIIELHGIEFYLIYKFMYGKPGDSFKIISEKLYNAFLKKPYKYFDSYLFDDEKVSFIFPFWKVHKIKKIKKIIKKNVDVILKIGPKDENERHFLMKYLKLHIDLDDMRQRDLIEKIIDSGSVPKDPEELNFFGSYVSKWMLKKSGYEYLDIPLFSATFELDNSLEGFAGRDYIFMKINTDSSILDTINVICHETWHIIQYEEYKKLKGGFRKIPELNIGFDYFIFEKFGSVFYNKNYRFSRMEIDAEKAGFNFAKKFLDFLNKSDLSKKIEYLKRESFECRGVQYEYIMEPIMSNSNVDYEKEYYEYAMSSLLDQLVKENLNYYIMDVYPILYNLYDEKGKARGIKELLKNDFSNYDNLELFFNHTFRYIQEGGLDNLNLNNSTVFNNLNIMLNKVKDKIIEMLDLSPNVLLDRYESEDEVSYKEVNDIYKSELIYYYSFICKVSKYLYMNIDKITFKDELVSNIEILIDKLFIVIKDNKDLSILNDKYNELVLIYNSLRKESVKSIYEKWFKQLVPEKFKNIIVSFHGEKYFLIDYVCYILPLYANPQDISILSIDGGINFDKHLIKIISNQLDIDTNLNDIFILIDLIKDNVDNENIRNNYVDMFNKIISRYDKENYDYASVLRNAFNRAQMYYEENKFTSTPIDANNYTDEVNEIISRSIK